MGLFLDFADLSPLAPSLAEDEADIYIEDIEAQAADVAPCIIDPMFPHHASVKSILRQAVLRWHRAGEGGLSSQQQSAGSFSFTNSFDNRTRGEGRLLVGEEDRLRRLCKAGRASGGRKAFSVTPR